MKSFVSCCLTGSVQEMKPDSQAVHDDEENIIENPNFEEGLTSWSGRGCKILLNDSLADGKIVPLSGKFFVSTENRTQSWNGIQQEITGKVQRKLAYEIASTVRIFSVNVTDAEIRATLWVQSSDLREQYIGISSVRATVNEWTHLKGKFLLNASPTRVVIYFEGPLPGTNILLNNLVVKHAAKAPAASPPSLQNAEFGVNIIANSNLIYDTSGWFPLGNCTMSVKTGSPCIIPPMARESLGVHEPLSGRYIDVTNRKMTWMGPGQEITAKVKLYLTYQVSVWVRIGNTLRKPQAVNVALDIDGEWVNGGQVEINEETWHEICGSFRVEKQPLKVIVYVQGPDAGIDLMVAGLQIFAVDRNTRFEYLKKQTDKIRKRDIVLKLNSSDSDSLQGTFVKIQQKKNSFPLGSCISRTNMDNEDFMDFFVKNFNWGVFGNELKWYWTEPQQGNFNYKDADELLSWCSIHNIPLRGHCIFWEVESTVQPWIKSLSKNDMMIAVHKRLNDLLTRYKGKFKHYDVNNEMLHGSFYKEHLGKEIHEEMFKIASKLDPNATLFVNDYHIEDGCDTRSSPEKYIHQILDLGAYVGGIGIQGHIDSPIGPIIRSALDKLGILGLPIWFTELDVSSSNEFVRADDLEVMLREAFAHPCVEGVMLWGFWELFMSRENGHLVNAEGEVNECGKRLICLGEEWLSEEEGFVDENCEFKFRGFQGSYEVEIFNISRGNIVKLFVVEPASDPLVVILDL